MKIIKNVLRYKLNNKTIGYYLEPNKNSYIFLDFDFNLIKKVDVKKSHWFFEDEKYLKIGYDLHERTGYFQNYELSKILTNSYNFILNDIGIAYDYSNSDGKTHQETLFKLPEETPILSEWLPNSIYHIEGKYWCNDTEKDFKLIDALKGTILWTIPQPQVEKPYGDYSLTNIKKVLGIYNNMLWLLLPDSRIWGLDILTGEVKEEVESEYFLVHKDCIFLDSSKGQIIVFSFDLHILFELNTLSFSNQFILPKNIRISKSNLYLDDKIVFIGNKDAAFSPNIYGIFNRATLTFEFIGEQVTEDAFFYQTPQVNKELFAILDSEGNLIIHRLDEILNKSLMQRN